MESIMAIKKSKNVKKPNNQKNNLGREKQTRIEILRSIAEKTELAKIQVEAVFFALGELLHAHMHKRGSGEFTIPMIGVKVRRVKKKATKARTMLSPLTGEEVTIAGKPARLAIRLSALKPLKLAVQD
jgi:Bacterial DNA-binding protein